MTTAQDGGKVFGLTHRPPLAPGYTPGTQFYYRMSRPQDHSATGRIMSLKNSNDTIGNRNCGLQVCGVVSLIKVLELSWAHEIESREIGRIKKYAVWKEPIRTTETQHLVVQKWACGFP
jgi:hypothetical protein